MSVLDSHSHKLCGEIFQTGSKIESVISVCIPGLLRSPQIGSGLFLPIYPQSLFISS
jgi:hypothetical protein